MTKTVKKKSKIETPESSLSARDEAMIVKVAKTVVPFDLYDALHQVGDDPIKVVIEETLRDMLDETTFKRVVAVFKIATEGA